MIKYSAGHTRDIVVYYHYRVLCAIHSYMCYTFFVVVYFIFRERGREGERGWEMVASYIPPAGDLACNPGMCPDQESNLRPFASRARAQSTELHQPGVLYFYNDWQPCRFVYTSTTSNMWVMHCAMVLWQLPCHWTIGIFQLHYNHMGPLCSPCRLKHRYAAHDCAFLPLFTCLSSAIQSVSPISGSLTIVLLPSATLEECLTFVDPPGKQTNKQTKNLLNEWVNSILSLTHCVLAQFT